MSKRLYSDLAEELIGSEIIQLSSKIKELQAKGNKIYNCTIGDFDSNIYPIPAELEHAVNVAYRKGNTNYPAGNGTPEIRNAISKFIKNYQGLQYSANEVLIAGGARPLIYAAFRALVNPGDKVLFPVPSWNNLHYTYLCGATPLTVETTPENNFMPTAESLAPHIQEANLLALCSPLNPTGTTFSQDQLLAICTLVQKENKRRSKAGIRPLYVLFDQIYWLLTYGVDHFDPVSLVNDLREHTIYIDGLSKAFAATGLRVGWAFGPEELIQKMTAINSHVGAWAGKPEQIGVADYFSDRSNIDINLKNFKEELRIHLNKVHQGFQILKIKEHPVDSIKPQAAMYVSVKIDLIGKVFKNKEIKNVKQQTDLLITEAKLGVVPFTIFGASDDSVWYRLSVGTLTDSDINDLLVALEVFLEKVR